MPDHREAAAALHADVGGELRHGFYSSEVLIRGTKDVKYPTVRASVGDNGLFYVTAVAADHDLARDILRLVVAARERRPGVTEDG